MSSYTITTTADEDAAIAHYAGEGTDLAAFFDRSVHAWLANWVRQYHATTAPRTAEDVANAYLMAASTVQQQVVDDLGMTSPKAEGAA